MKESEAKKLPKSKEATKAQLIIDSIPQYLKDPKNYKRIQKAILDAGATKHSHGEVGEWALCAHCQSKEKDRLLFMRKLGFQSAAQYLTWKKIHEEIKTRYPLVDWAEEKMKL